MPLSHSREQNVDVSSVSHTGTDSPLHLMKLMRYRLGWRVRGFGFRPDWTGFSPVYITRTWHIG